MPITKPCMGQEELEAVQRPIKSGWLMQGPEVQKFERQVSDFTGIANSIAVTSATTALHLTLLAAGIQTDDEVIVPSFTYVATANAVIHAGAKPVLVDIDPLTYNMSIESFTAAITPKTKAVMPVHLFGLMADISAILKIAEDHNLTVIEDAACALGSTYKGKHAGSFGQSGVLSFHPRKIITCGEGGVILTNDDQVNANSRSLRDHGISFSKVDQAGKTALLPDFPVVGYNYRMTDLQAAIAGCQMDKLDFILEKRRKIAKTYDNALKDNEILQTPFVPENFQHSYQAYVCRLKTETGQNHRQIEQLHAKRNLLMERLEKDGVSTRQGTHAVHMLGYYRDNFGYTASSLPNSYAADKLTIALPLYPSMTTDEVEYVIEMVKKHCRNL